jgi:hypothetical protein
MRGVIMTQVTATTAMDEVMKAMGSGDLEGFLSMYDDEIVYVTNGTRIEGK